MQSMCYLESGKQINWGRFDVKPGFGATRLIPCHVWKNLFTLKKEGFVLKAFIYTKERGLNV